MVRLRGNWPAVAGLAALVVGAALAVVAVAVVTGGESRPPPTTRGGVLATARLTPRTLSFGDRLDARFNVAIDRDRVDPRGVRLSANFSPFQSLAPIRVVRRDEGGVTLLTYSLVLGCDEARCLPRSMNEKREFEFPAARITFRRRSSVGTFRDLVDVPLPRVGIASRLSFQEIQQSRQANPLRAVDLNNRTLTPEDVTGVWRDDSAVLPAVSYRVSPSLLAGLLIGLALLLVVAAVALALRQLRPRERAVEAPDQPVVLTPLEHALETLELALANGHVDQQRKALELVASELGETGEETLALEARQLAWAEQDPGRPEARALVETVRTSVNGRSDGRQPS